MTSNDEEHILEIHTGDRGAFKRCRRRWGLQSMLRRNLVAAGQPESSPLWLGSGFHFAMEDYFGRKRFAHPVDAFRAYRAAGKPDELPDNVDDDTDLAVGMIRYYVDDWLKRHPEPYETLWVDDVPQVEVEVTIDITGLLPMTTMEHAAMWCKECKRDRHGKLKGELRYTKDGVTVDGVLHRVLYVTTFDRVVIDEHDRIWGVDYKTAGEFANSFLQMNPQVGAYDWAMSVYYGDDAVEGLIWQQHLKAVPAEPKLIRDGKALSTDKRQYTSHSIYKKAVLDMFGTVPNEYVEMLNFLAEAESVEGDRFIRRDPLHRNAAQRRAEQEKIVLEVIDMLDPGLPMYPNPTRDCAWDCQFKAACMMMDDGSDAEEYLRDEFVQWGGYKDDWRGRIVYPDAKKEKKRATR